MPAGNTPGVRSLVPPPGEFSDIRYVQGIAGQEFREILGPGDCCAAGSARIAERAQLARDPARANAPPPAGGFGGLNVEGLPITKPPYGMLAAIDLDKGQVKWQTPHGDTPDQVRNHAALKGMNIPKTGQAQTSGVGLVITKTLVIMGDPVATTTPEHPRGAMLRAYDKASGREVGAVYMPAAQSGNPMTYMVDGKQYIIVAVSGGRYSGEYIAYSLPN
jgi:quinoprotein glucose dehydrogenase